METPSAPAASSTSTATDSADAPPPETTKPTTTTPTTFAGQLRQVLGPIATSWSQLVALWTFAVHLLDAAYEATHDRLRRHPVIGEVYEVIDGIFVDYGRDHSAIYAGALAFYAVLSLIPLAVLFASVFGFFLSSGNEADIDAALVDVIRQLRKIIPYLQPSLAEDLKVVVENRNKLGIVGFVALLWAASEVFRGVEFATARIFARLDDHDDPDHRKTAVRSVLKTKLLFGAVATAVAITFVALRLIGGVLLHVREQFRVPAIVDAFVGDPLGDGSALAFCVTAVGIVLGFVVLVRVFSPHRVQTKFAALGGVVFYVFFQLAHYGYDLYLERLTNVGAMYGSFAALIIIVLWMYYCASLLLVCCHGVKVAQRRMTVGPRWPKDGKLFLV